MKRIEREGEKLEQNNHEQKKPKQEKTISLKDFVIGVNSEERIDNLKALALFRQVCSNFDVKSFFSLSSEEQEKVSKENLLFQYLSSSPGATELFNMMKEQRQERSSVLLASLFDTFAVIFKYNRFPKMRHLNEGIAKKLFSEEAKNIYATLSSQHHQITIAVLKMLQEMILCEKSVSRFIFQQFNFSLASLESLVNNKQIRSKNKEKKPSFKDGELKFVYLFICTHSNHWNKKI